MGFGLLFFGYLMMFNIPFHGVDVFVDLAGYLFIFAAMRKLEAYNAFFLWAKRISVVMCAVSGVNLAMQLAGLFTAVPAAFTSLMAAVTAAGVLVFHYFMLFGIRGISRYTEDRKLESKANRNWYLTLVYYAALCILSVPAAADAAGQYFNLPLYAFGLVWMLLNLSLIFSCYARICLEGDEDMPYRPNWLEQRFKELLDRKSKREK